MKLKSLKKIKKLNGKRVLLRVDFNVPVKNGAVADDFKIIRHLPTIRFLLRYNCKVIVMTHLGRPSDGFDHRYSVKPIASYLSEVIGKEVGVSKQIAGIRAGTMVAQMEKGGILMLENVRFEKGEEANDPKFASELAALAEIYVNDAFAASHRDHASVSAIRRYLPSYMGLLLEKEITNLNKALKPVRPLALLIGGAKIRTKIPILKKFRKADKILVGGALANTFLKTRGFKIGKSLTDKDSERFANEYNYGNIILPVDAVVSSKIDGGKTQVKSISKIDDSDYILDIGPKTIRLYAGIIRQAKTIVWNGPLGMFELKDFRHGTLSLAKIVASRSSGRAFGVVGGGETVEALKLTKMQDYVDWVSTGGGAMLSYLGGEKMPGIN